METSHPELMRTLLKLCKPDPKHVDGKVCFENVRGQMVTKYAQHVDDPDFLHAFTLVIETGGSESPHMKDLEDFTAVYVNSKFRNVLTLWISRESRSFP